ncbi:MAG TPA: exo-alpha-sialidase [Candidatus Hydrogenedentes bacterium]|nr:exo-alpha-sialidase [Candidatus Hydrogenedentota bacterium]
MFIRGMAVLITLVIASYSHGEEKGNSATEYTITLDTISSGYDGETCWVHPRAGTIPGEKPIVVLTMQKLLLSGSDIFYALNEMRTDDLGKVWDEPKQHSNLGRRPNDFGSTSVVCDFTPMWHAPTKKLLGTGHSAMYNDKNRLIHNPPRETAYAVYDPDKRTWTTWHSLNMPDDPIFYNSGAGSTQRVDLPNGDILLPIYCKAEEGVPYSTTVIRCRFDGDVLSYVEHGNIMTVDIQRGFVEPSLAHVGGRFFLTIRNDESGYVTSSADGLHYDTPRKWTFDDGGELGSYNTQQHWVTHGDTLYLVYTRRGADNDHVFRHRGPLFIAEVDQENLQVIRGTERVLVPERGARLGNFAVTKVTANETWISVAEWMQRNGRDYVIPVDNAMGADNSVYIARLKWK